MRLLDFDRDAYELQINGMTVLFSYTRPIAVRDGEGKFFQTDEKLTKSSVDHLAKWLRSMNATGKAEQMSQYELETYCDPSR